MAAFSIGYLGDPDNRPQPESLGTSVMLRSLGPEPNDALLIDGSAAGRIADTELRGFLDAGKPVGLIRPNDATLARLRTLTGHAPLTPVELALWRKRPDGAHCSCVLPMITTKGGGAGDDGVPVELPTLVRPVATTIAEAFASPPAAIDSHGMPPPAGAYYGCVSTAVHLDQSIPYPQFKGKPDDKVVRTYMQCASGSFQLDLHVYWVNGASDDAYYLVVAHQTGSVFAGYMLADGKNNQGFFQTSLALYIRAGALSGLTREAYSPSTAKGSIATHLQTQMLLWGLAGSGEGAIRFTAEYDNQIEWPSWAMLDHTHDTTCCWVGYQSDVWNVLQHPPESWSNDAAFASSLFQSNGHVRAMPDQSKGSIAFDTIASFIVRPPVFAMPNPCQASPPPPCTVRFAAEVAAQTVLFHNKDGCRAARGNHERDGFWRTNSGSLNAEYELSRIAVMTGHTRYKGSQLSGRPASRWPIITRALHSTTTRN